MPKFERFDNHHGGGYTGGGARVVATLSGNAKSPILLIGSKLLGAGFDVEKRYVFLFDSKSSELGLEPPANGEVGFKVMRTTNSRGTHTAYSIRAQGFCQNFGIRERLEAVSFKRSGKTWILKMRQGGISEADSQLWRAQRFLDEHPFGLSAVDLAEFAARESLVALREIIKRHDEIGHQIKRFQRWNIGLALCYAFFVIFFFSSLNWR